MIFIRASISIKELIIDMLIKILESERDDTIPYFLIETTNSLSAFLLISANTINSKLF